MIQKLSLKISRWIVKKVERFPSSTRKNFDVLMNIALPIRLLKDRIYISKLSQISKQIFVIDEKIGFCQLPPLDADSEQMINLARKCKELVLAGELQRHNSKEYLQQIFDMSNINRDSLFLLELGLNPNLLLSIQRYLHSYPLLHEVSVFYSPESISDFTSENFAGSQLFHRDGGGTKCLKLWLLCEDVSKENGPTVLIPSGISHEISKRLNYHPGDKISDSKFLTSELAQAVPLTGKKGDWFATDTDNCFHYGSRTTKKSSRLVIMFHYVEHNSSYYMPFLRQNYIRKLKPLSPAVKEFCQTNVYAARSLRYRLSL